MNIFTLRYSNKKQLEETYQKDKSRLYSFIYKYVSLIFIFFILIFLAIKIRLYDE